MLGDELARRAIRLRRDIKAVLISGYASDWQGADAREFLLLRKPYRLEELARAISDALGR
jgi:hypothetical protein